MSVLLARSEGDDICNTASRVSTSSTSHAVQLHNVLRAISEEMIVLERDKVAIAARMAEAELEHQRIRSDVQAQRDGEGNGSKQQLSAMLACPSANLSCWLGGLCEQLMIVVLCSWCRCACHRASVSVCASAVGAVLTG